uniref:hypothetical protein n=1 Tax=Fulvivirga sp. TaxID=1931237 RepID=UPI00404ABC4A
MSNMSSNASRIILGCIVLLILLNTKTFAQDSKPIKVKEFNITIEKVNSTVLKLKCPHDCAWIEINFDSKSEPMQLIDEYGQTTVGQSRTTIDKRLADFLFSVDLKGNEVTLKGLHGTNWKELTFILPEDGAREFTESGL